MRALCLFCVVFEIEVFDVVVADYEGNFVSFSCLYNMIMLGIENVMLCFSFLFPFFLFYLFSR